MILYGIGLLTTYLCMSGCGTEGNLIIGNLIKGVSFGGGIGAQLSHNGVIDECETTSNEYTTGDATKKEDATIGAILGADLAKGVVRYGAQLNSFIVGSASALGAGVFSEQTGKQYFTKPAIIIGTMSTIGDMIY